MQKKPPITVLSGFLGSGKTTLLKHLLENRENRKFALIVNDMAELNIDARLIADGSDLSQTEEKMISLQNGCICCTLRDDLIQEIYKIATSGKNYDAIIIESTGVAESIPIAQTITYPDDISGINLSDFVQLDTMVTVIDAKNFLKNFGSDEILKDRDWQTGEDDERTIVNLMTEQIEFCDVIILNKISEISEDEKHRVKAIIRGLQPKAQLIETDFGKVPLQEIVMTGKFDQETAEESPLWVQELMNGGHHTHTRNRGVRN